MIAACEERGADLFLAARGAEPPPGIASHVSSCAACRAELERLRVLVRDLPSASEGLAPRPATREEVLRTVRGEPAPGAVRALPRPGRPRRPWLALAAAAAGIAATVFVLSRGPAGPRVDAPASAVEVTALWGGAALDGVVPGGLGAGAEIAARKVASVRLGSPVDAEVVLGEGTRLRLPPAKPGRIPGRVVELLAGPAWFDAGSGSSAAGARGEAPPRPLVVRAGSLEVEDRGAHFTVERRVRGDVAVWIEAGVAVVRAAGGEVTASGPCRVDVPAGGRPTPAAPAEAGDATGWFAYPELTIEERPGAKAGERDLVLTLLPAVPRRIRVAPYHRFDPLFSLRAFRAGKGEVKVPLRPAMLRRPPPEADSDGAFLLGPERPYRIYLDPGALGLEPGRYAIRALYTASRPGGPWRGNRTSNPLEVAVE